MTVAHATTVAASTCLSVISLISVVSVTTVLISQNLVKHRCLNHVQEFASFIQSNHESTDFVHLSAGTAKGNDGLTRLRTTK